MYPKLEEIAFYGPDTVIPNMFEEDETSVPFVPIIEALGIKEACERRQPEIRLILEEIDNRSGGGFHSQY